MSDEVTNIPDIPETKLALRCWRLDMRKLTLLSLTDHGRLRNAPNQQAWFSRALSRPEGGWDPEEPLRAICGNAHREDHGPIPGADCTCGIYATTSLSVINGYLSPDAPVLGIVEMGGHTIPATQGYRAYGARVAGIIAVEEILTLPHSVLDDIAAKYDVPLLTDFSTDPEDYRDKLVREQSVGDAAEAWLRDLMDGGGQEAEGTS
jgi:hypothetical protein